MTMVLPFALVIALTVRSCLLLFVCATLFSLATQCVESAAPSRAFFDDLTMMTVTVTVSQVSNSSNSGNRGRQWDPGMPLSLSLMTVHADGAFRDRTDRPPAPLHASIGSMSPIECLSLIAWLFCPSLSSSRPTPTQPIALFIATNILEPRCRLLRSGCLDFWLTNNTVSLVEFHPGIASSVSVFHCCHPMLARAVVPNVDT